MQKGSSSSVRIFYPEFDQGRILSIIAQRLGELESRLPLVRVVLFGSYAKENYTVGSDVDLLVVYHGKRRDDAFALVKHVFDIPRLEPHIYTQEEYAEIQGTLSKMTADGIVCFQKREQACQKLA